jgi:hypothetical protein
VDDAHTFYITCSWLIGPSPEGGEVVTTWNVKCPRGESLLAYSRRLVHPSMVITTPVEGFVACESFYAQSMLPHMGDLTFKL